MEFNKIHNEDCLLTLSKMPDNFVDLVVTSPHITVVLNMILIMTIKIGMIILIGVKNG